MFLCNLVSNSDKNLRIFCKVGNVIFFAGVSGVLSGLNNANANTTFLNEDLNASLAPSHPWTNASLGGKLVTN